MKRFCSSYAFAMLVALALWTSATSTRSQQLDFRPVTVIPKAMPAIKDAKLRTFITEDSARDDMVAHVYDITYGTVKRGVDNLVVIDDSIVRGTTSIKIVQMMREAGASEVHIRVASPEIYYPDFYGIDTPDRDRLLANQHETLEDMCKHIGADSLNFISLDGLYDAVGGIKRDPKNPQFTDHYFTGDYPTRLVDQENVHQLQRAEMLA